MEASQYNEKKNDKKVVEETEKERKGRRGLIDVDAEHRVTLKTRDRRKTKFLFKRDSHQHQNNVFAFANQSSL